MTVTAAFVPMSHLLVQGQCGLGTPLEEIASQHRRSFYQSLRPVAHSPAQRRAAAHAGGHQGMGSSGVEGSSVSPGCVRVVTEGWAAFPRMRIARVPDFMAPWCCALHSKL